MYQCGEDTAGTWNLDVGLQQMLQGGSDGGSDVWIESEEKAWTNQT